MGVAEEQNHKLIILKILVFLPAVPLEYILPELLKNAVRATVEAHPEGDGYLPPIHITIASNEVDFIIK